jgi:ubiquinone/menaquinone biosynthesis C-methylase UbiE
MQNSNIREWYNDFSLSQIRTSVNLRHYSIINKLISSGLKKDSKTLEIGCGIGTLTGLILNYVSKGRVLGVDISDESIKIARQRLGESARLELIISDMKNFQYPNNFDFIVLPDVLEHIPLENHDELFETIGRLTHENSKILIHIPHPRALDYYRLHNPELLQIIDQSIEAISLVNSASKANFILKKYEAYCLFSTEPDYVYLEFEKNKNQIPKNISKTKIILKKIKLRTKYFLNLMS